MDNQYRIALNTLLEDLATQVYHKWYGASMANMHQAADKAIVPTASLTLATAITSLFMLQHKSRV